jgi:hypothetical protein
VAGDRILLTSAFLTWARALTSHHERVHPTPTLAARVRVRVSHAFAYRWGHLAQVCRCLLSTPPTDKTVTDWWPGTSLSLSCWKPI